MKLPLPVAKEYSAGVPAGRFPPLICSAQGKSAVGTVREKAPPAIVVPETVVLFWHLAVTLAPITGAPVAAVPVTFGVGAVVPLLPLLLSLPQAVRRAPVTMAAGMARPSRRVLRFMSLDSLLNR